MSPKKKGRQVESEKQTQVDHNCRLAEVIAALNVRLNDLISYSLRHQVFLLCESRRFEIT